MRNPGRVILGRAEDGWPEPRETPITPMHPSPMARDEMKPIPRPSFLRGSITAGLALGMPRLMRGAGPTGSDGPNDAVNLAVIGLGSTTAVGGVGGRGHQLIGRLREIPGARIVALCDAD